MDRAIPEHIEHVNEVLSDLFTPEEEETFSSLLRRLRDHLYDTRSEWALSPGEADPCDAAGLARPAPVGAKCSKGWRPEPGREIQSSD